LDKRIGRLFDELPVLSPNGHTLVSAEESALQGKQRPLTYIRATTMPSSTIAIIGTGAVGGCYGAKLHDAGNKVLFHMRGPNYRAGQQSGLTLKSVSGDVFIPPAKLHAYQSTHEMAAAVGVNGFDWVVIALKSTAMDEIADLVDPLLSGKTRLLLLMNGLVEDAVIQRLKKKGCRYHSVYGGAAFVCAERTAPAVIEHRRYGAISAALAESMSSDDDHEAALHNLFKGTSVDLTYETSLLRGRWKKMMVNLSVCDVMHRPRPPNSTNMCLSG
jgi:2-dehydropantoate 2-reductase